MKRLTYFLAAAMCANVMFAQAIVKQKDVVGAGAVNAQTADNSLHLRGTVGQAVSGVTVTNNGTVYQGFWTPGTGATGIEITRQGAPSLDFTLDQNYPNPYAATTTISFAVPTNSHVVVSVFSMAGVLVQRLVDDNVTAGKYNVTFDGSSLSSGTYFYTMQSGEHLITKRMVVIR